MSSRKQKMESIKYDLENKAACHASAELYLNEEFADINFKIDCNGEIHKVPANKAVLSVLSPVFKAGFYGLAKDQGINNGEVQIYDATIDEFKDFLKFFYFNKVTISMENIEAVVRLADKYQVRDYVNSAADLLENKLTFDNMCWGYQLALMLGNDELKVICEKYISGYPNEIFKSESFKHCDQMVLTHILNLNSLACKEYDVLDACFEWAKVSCKLNGIDDNKPENLRKQLGECFELIRFGVMKSNEFTTHTESQIDMFSAEECKDLFYTTTNEKFKSSKFNQDPRSNPVYQWHDDKQLVGLIENTTSEKIIYLSNRTSAFFSVSYPVLMGKIYFHRLLKRNRCNPTENVNIDFKVSVIEHDDPSLKSWYRNISSSEIRYYYDVKPPQIPYITLSQPIVINPNKMYQIVWETSTSDYSEHFYYPSSSSDVTIDSSITVKFHSHYNDSTGLLSRLCFNRL